MAETVTTPDVNTDSSPVKTSIKESPEFIEEQRKWREEHKRNLDAELERKKAELDVQYRAQPQNQPAAPLTDWYADYEVRHGIGDGTGAAARELMQGALTLVNKSVVEPMSKSQKTILLKLQRQEIRGNPKLANLDDRYHAEAMKLLEGIPAGQIADDSYARALHMTIGQHYEELESEREAPRGEDPGGQRDPEIVRPPPRNNPPAPKSSHTLSAHQKARASEMGLSDEAYIDVMKTRAVNLLSRGKNRDEVRARLGNDISGIEF